MNLKNETLQVNWKREKNNRNFEKSTGLCYCSDFEQMDHNENDSS